MIIFDRPVKGVSHAALERFARRAQKLAGVKGEVAILVTSQGKVQALNRRFRKKDKPTDVLSFPGAQRGDIAICAEIARRNAARLGHSVMEEIKVLVLHGMLHLAGYDHEADHGEMAAREARLRSRLKLPVALIQRSSPVAAAQRGSAGTLARRRRKR